MAVCVFWVVTDSCKGCASAVPMLEEHIRVSSKDLFLESAKGFAIFLCCADAT
jgi:hypothetical protein